MTFISRLLRTWALLLGLACAQTTLSAADAAVEIERDIVYSTPGGNPLKLDLARPSRKLFPKTTDKDAERLPVLICIHGGGWRIGRRQDMNPLIEGAAKRGYVAVSPSYRLTPGARWPAQRDDMRAVLSWIHTEADKRGFDTARIGATGFSAGGQLALMLGTLAETSTGKRRPVQAVVNYFGPTDLSAEFYKDDKGSHLGDLIGASRAENGAAYRDVSPISHVDAGDTPILTLHGSEDPLVPVEHARQFHKTLDRLAIPNELHVLEGRGHGWDGEDMLNTFDMSMDFFDLYLQGGKRLELLVLEDFDNGGDRWNPSDANAWKIETIDDNPCYALFQKSNYTPPVRSPLNFALLGENMAVEDFTLDLQLQSTKADYIHLDLCLFFGYEAPDRYYYVHLGKVADPHAHSIFLVNGKPRVSIAKERTDGTPWDKSWHHVRLHRETESGVIEVFWDDMKTPVMRTEDKTFLSGRVGIGSFDDTGRFDDIRLWGRRAAPPTK
jgi:acetyl esterase/lipase